MGKRSGLAERGENRKTVDTCWHPRWRWRRFSLAPRLGWSLRERGSSPLMNPLRAARTRARIRFSSGPARGAQPAPLPTPMIRGWGGVSCQKAQLRALAEQGEGVRGVPGSAQEASASTVWRARREPCLGVLPGCRVVSRRPQDGGAARSPASLEPAPRFPGPEELLQGKPWAGALTAESWPAAPLRGRPPSPRSVRQPARGHLTIHHPAPFASSFCSGWHLPFSRRRVLPIHRTDPAVKARLQRRLPCREAAKSPGDRKKGNPAGAERGTACLLLPGSAVRAGCKNDKTLR